MTTRCPTLGRLHTAGEATEACERALAEGFDSVSIDLIFAVPGQGIGAWEHTVKRAAELRPEHISSYELTIHEGTRFFGDRQAGTFHEETDDDKAGQFFALHRLLAEFGYEAYEVSNFCRDTEFRSRHNTKYWRHLPYLGIGPSAHSFDGGRRRWWNHRGLPPVVRGRGCGRARWR